MSLVCFPNNNRICCHAWRVPTIDTPGQLAHRCKWHLQQNDVYLILVSSPAMVDPAGYLLSERGSPRVSSLASGLMPPMPCSAKLAINCDENIETDSQTSNCSVQYHAKKEPDQHQEEAVCRYANECFQAHAFAPVGLQSAQTLAMPATKLVHVTFSNKSRVGAIRSRTTKVQDAAE